MMNFKRHWLKYICFIIGITIFLADFQLAQTVYAESLPYYNYNTDSNVDYYGQQVTFYYNNKPLTMTHPGIIMKGAALADYEELFVRELGLEATLSGDKLLLSNRKITMQLTLGSTEVIINGTKQYTSVPPAKLKFTDGTEKIYIPTRFVAETFGYSYVWNSRSGTVHLAKTLYLKIGSRDVAYSGSFYSIYHAGQELALGAPVFYYQGNVLVPMKNAFESLGCQYEVRENEFQITKGETTLQLMQDSNNISINGKQYTIEYSPILITNKETKGALVYIPLEFLAEVLEFDLSYDEETNKYILQEAEFNKITGNMAEETNPASSFYKAVKLDTLQTPEEIYFEWYIPEKKSTLKNFGSHISKISAYAIKEADVLELYGINSSDIEIFFENGLLIFHLKNVLSELNTQSYLDFSNPFLNYILQIQLPTSTKLFFMIPENSTWTIVDKDGYVQVYFMKDLYEENLFLSSVNTPRVEDYPEEQLIIPLPVPGSIANITDKDNYLDKNFQLLLSGNYLEFYEHNQIINPYTELIEKYTVTYDSNVDCTILTFYTTQICGYQYAMTPNYLSMIVARPQELYSKIVLLDAGHGGFDPGAVFGEYYEKNLNFVILNTYVKDLLEDSDIKVYFTRETDVKIDLYTRAKFASEIGADLFISLHMNSGTSSDLQGTEVFYSEANNDKTSSGLTSYLLAKRMSDNIAATLGTKKRGATDSNYMVIKYNTVPAILIELGFMSNELELKKLTNSTYQKRAAQAICLTIEQMFLEYDTGR